MIGVFEVGKMRTVKNFACLMVCLTVCLLPTWALDLGLNDDQMQGHHHDASEHLGKVSFPISCASESQKPFERGVALLHSFGYEEAEAQFVEVAQKDPACAMAHWGVALSLFHQIWERPDPPALKRGWDEIEIAQKIGAKTERERGYISALALFYRDSATQDHLKRAGAYSDAMGKLFQQYPTDVEAGAFYGLSLLAAASPKDTTLSSEKKAVEVLNKLFQQQPDHPGLAHYIIHACDSPQLAPLGLDAARRYAGIASSSAHAVHMPSHIFARLGLWQEDIQANLKSVALAHPSGEMYMHGHELHAMHFLLYAYVQTGQDEAAKQILEQSKQILATAPAGDTGMLEYYGFAAAHFPAILNLEMRRWPDVAALEPAAGALPDLQMITYWARTIGSAHMGDVEATRRNVQKLGELEEAVRKSKYAYTLEGPQIGRDEARAWLAFAEKRNDDALRQMRAVADTQDKIGKREVDIPAREMLGDMLLEFNQPETALAEFETSLKTDPNRYNGLAGVARAAEMAHHSDKANAYYAQLLKNCDNGKNSDRPELTRARTVLAKNLN
jgi:tetratricopeptide (TPR) repeat protein